MAVEGIGNGKIVSIEALRQARAAQAAQAGPRPASAPPAGAADREDSADVRRDKVIEAKLRISTGYYNREEVRREILRSLLSSFLPPAATEPGQTPAQTGETSPEEPSS